MISLTRLNGDTFTFNAIYIEQLQSNPDTTITTTQGRKFVVKEPEELVIRRIKKFYKEIGLFRIVDRVEEDG
ncbi:flagellar FlbD family protein [Halobacillus locisalis]|uniref:Flagellar FlbD family protein n=1 Tax=Halobacillus locisalis TaxID=220753 RepID=A0A838CQR9_9BACI|nr:flagellar FlbD family protein [Halobacillus locisalis]MBA2174105.1 flagellar FlbD family protein [Halobacillus locisalis]